MAAYASVGLAHDGALPAGMLGYGGGLAVLFGAAHVALRRLAPDADPIMLPVVTVINGLGLAVIHRLDLAYADRARQLGHDVPSAAAPAQLTWTAVGVILFIVVLLLVRDHRVLQRFTYTAMLAGLVLLVLPLLPVIGSTINGARIWIRLAGFSFQPGELAKLALLVFFAGYLVVKRDVLALASRRVARHRPAPRPRPRAGRRRLAGQPRRARLRARPRHLAAVLRRLRRDALRRDRAPLLAAHRHDAVPVRRRSWPGRSFGHVHQRVDIWLHPFAPRNIDSDSYQLVQGLFGMGTGGMLGKGLGQGRPDIVPYAQTDFIVAAIGEELGLTGIMALLILYAIVVQRGLRTAIAVRDSFGKLLADRPGVQPGAAGLRRRRRRHPADPADRPHHAVPVLRRVVAGRQLGAGRAAAADQRRRPPAGPTARERRWRTPRPRWCRL